MTGRHRRLSTTMTTVIVPPSLLFSLLLLAFLLRTGAAQGQGSNNNVNVLASASSPSCVAADGSFISTTSVIISTANEATQLGQNLLKCPGSAFEVEWRGSVQLSQLLTVSDGTSLTIVGWGSTPAVIHGSGLTALFELNKSSLRLEGLSLTGGSAADGGAVAARGDALVTFVDCVLYENTATSTGGERDWGRGNVRYKSSLGDSGLGRRKWRGTKCVRDGSRHREPER